MNVRSSGRQSICTVPTSKVGGAKLFHLIYTGDPPSPSESKQSIFGHLQDECNFFFVDKLNNLTIWKNWKFEYINLEINCDTVVLLTFCFFLFLLQLYSYPPRLVFLENPSTHFLNSCLVFEFIDNIFYKRILITHKKTLLKRN